MYIITKPLLHCWLRINIYYRNSGNVWHYCYRRISPQTPAINSVYSVLARIIEFLSVIEWSKILFANYKWDYAGFVNLSSFIELPFKMDYTYMLRLCSYLPWGWFNAQCECRPDPVELAVHLYWCLRYWNTITYLLVAPWKQHWEFCQEYIRYVIIDLCKEFVSSERIDSPEIQDIEMFTCYFFIVQMLGHLTFIKRRIDRCMYVLWESFCWYRCLAMQTLLRE